MAKQTGIIKGIIDNIAFYKTADGHLAHAKGKADRDKILHSAAFARTRENKSGFGRAVIHNASLVALATSTVRASIYLVTIAEGKMYRDHTATPK